MAVRGTSRFRNTTLGKVLLAGCVLLFASFVFSAFSGDGRFVAPVCDEMDEQVGVRCDYTSCNPPFFCNSVLTKFFLCPGGSKMVRSCKTPDGSRYNLVAGQCTSECSSKLDGHNNNSN